MHPINPQNITVVVQGAISGGSNEPQHRRHTDLCLKSIRKVLPGATIILSTWENNDVKNLDYDILIENKDPGSNMMGSYKSNCFRQIVSSINGLKKVQTKYTIKVRSDLLFTSSKFLDYFLYFNQLPFDNKYKILNRRIVTITTANPNRRYLLPFNISDWFFFGETKDLINIFDIPLQDHSYLDENNKISINPIYPEQFIWINFLKKHISFDFKSVTELVSRDSIILSEKYFANNCIFLNTRQVKLSWLKSKGKAYDQIPCLSNSGLYSFNDYKKILNKYANNSIKINDNYLEEAMFFINDFLRKIFIFLRHFNTLRKDK